MSGKSQLSNQEAKATMQERAKTCALGGISKLHVVGDVEGAEGERKMVFYCCKSLRMNMSTMRRLFKILVLCILVIKSY